MDFQRCEINPNKLKSFKIKKQMPSKNSSKINYVIKKLKKSKKPVIILGGGIKNAKAELKLKNFLKN